MKLYIIRHGETKLNALGRLQGWTDEPLNQNGKDLAIITGEALKEIPFDLVITSPLKRARETGELTVAASEKNFGRKIPIIEDRRIMEFNWGCRGLAVSKIILKFLILIIIYSIQMPFIIRVHPMEKVLLM